MNIALLAHDKKKELMVQFCIAYSGILAKHSICATATTGKVVSDTTGLNVHRFLEGRGGAEQISSRVAYDEIDLLLFFRDPSQAQLDDAEETLLRLCDMHHVPCATNIATAEVLVCALGRGDLDWREVYHTERNDRTFNMF